MRSGLQSPGVPVRPESGGLHRSCVAPRTVLCAQGSRQIAYHSSGPSHSPASGARASGRLPPAGQQGCQRASREPCAHRDGRGATNERCSPASPGRREHEVTWKADLIALLEKRNVLHRANRSRYGMPPMRARIGSSLKLSCCLERPMTSSSSSAIAARPGGTRRSGGGTSLNGQSQSDDILIDVRRPLEWRQSGG